MDTITINELLVLMNGVRNRLTSLKELRKQVATKEVWYTNTQKDVIPQYDVLKVDKHIVKLENFLMKADTLIKSSNAITKVSLTVDKEDLFSPLE